MQKLGNPAPLGLAASAASMFAFGLASLGLAGIQGVLPVVLFYGGVGLLLVAVLEFRCGNTFNLTAFGSFGALFLTLAVEIFALAHGWIPLAAAKGWEITLFSAYTIFTLLMMFGAFKVLKMAGWIYLLLTVNWALVDLHALTHRAAYSYLAGGVSIFTALVMWYLMAAMICIETFGRVVLPIGEVTLPPGHEEAAKAAQA